MIAIFVLLGLGFLGGGAAAIVDGLPYLVLERGFTQVIIGTVVATAGVILLALAWVLVEVRRVKATLANAAMAMSVASMAAAPQQQELAVATHDLMAARDLSPASGTETHGKSLGMAGAAIGAAAGAGGVLAATHAFQASAPTDAANDEAASVEHASVERDLFGDHTAEKNQVEQNEQEAANPPEPPPVLPAAEDYAFPAFDPFRSIDPSETSIKAETPIKTWNAPEASKETPVVAETVAELASDVPAEPEAIPDTQEAEDAAEETDEDHVQADEDRVEAEPSEHSGPVDWPKHDAPHVPEPEPVEVERSTDEFSFLRESLSGRQQERDQAGRRIEPSLQHGDEAEAAAADAESWMHPASRRRDPWFGEPTVANDPDQAEPKLDASKLDVPEFDEPKLDAAKLDAPHWPPQTREAAASVGDAEEEDDSEDAHAAPERDEAAGTAAPEPQASADAPAASNEGIVGAYQVGDAHFTIYADGSIQARTPDGDYNFASMDELKVYLASEKSRLGG